MEAMSRYDSKEAAVGVVSDTDITSVSGFETLFENVKISKNTVIRTDADISIRLNAVTNASISVEAGERFETDWLNVSKIFVTAAGGANLKILVAA